jgi:hypothetical protein
MTPKIFKTPMSIRHSDAAQGEGDQNSNECVVNHASMALLTAHLMYMCWYIASDSAHAGQRVGEELLRSEYALTDSAAAQITPQHATAAGVSMHAVERSYSHASGPFSRPVTPLNRSLSQRHRQGKDARREVSQSDSALTMRARAEKAAMQVIGKTPAAQKDYVTAFGAVKELARTPPQVKK